MRSGAPALIATKERTDHKVRLYVIFVYFRGYSSVPLAAPTQEDMHPQIQLLGSLRIVPLPCILDKPEQSTIIYDCWVCHSRRRDLG